MRKFLSDAVSDMHLRGTLPAIPGAHAHARSAMHCHAIQCQFIANSLPAPGPGP